MKMDDFNDLIQRGFEPSFNINDIHYMVSCSNKVSDDNKYYLADEYDELLASLKLINQLNEFYINGIKIKDIIPTILENEIYY